MYLRTRELAAFKDFRERAGFQDVGKTDTLEIDMWSAGRPLCRWIFSSGNQSETYLVDPSPTSATERISELANLRVSNTFQNEPDSRMLERWMA